MKSVKKPTLKLAEKAPNLAKSKIRKERRKKLKEAKESLAKDVEFLDNIKKAKNVSENEETLQSSTDVSSENSDTEMEDTKISKRGDLLMFAGTSHLDEVGEKVEEKESTTVKKKKSKKNKNDPKAIEMLEKETMQLDEVGEKVEENKTITVKKKKSKKKQKDPKATDIQVKDDDTKKNTPETTTANAKRNDEFLLEWNRVKGKHSEVIKEKKLTGKKKRKYLSVQRKRIYQYVLNQTNLKNLNKN